MQRMYKIYKIEQQNLNKKGYKFRADFFMSSFPEYDFYEKIDAYREVCGRILCGLSRISAHGLAPKRVS